MDPRRAMAWVQVRFAIRSRGIVGPDIERAGDRNQLKKYWLHGEGRARWATWTQLYNHLKKHLPSAMAKRVAAEWYHEATGRWPGSDANRVAHGKPPRGSRVGPG